MDICSEAPRTKLEPVHSGFGIEARVLFLVGKKKSIIMQMREWLQLEVPRETHQQKCVFVCTHVHVLHVCVRIPGPVTQCVCVCVCVCVEMGVVQPPCSSFLSADA